MDELTNREKEAAILAALGLSNREVAEQMGTTVGTVKNYVHRAIEKTGAYDRRELGSCLDVSGGITKVTFSTKGY